MNNHIFLAHDPNELFLFYSDFMKMNETYKELDSVLSEIGYKLEYAYIYVYKDKNRSYLIKTINTNTLPKIYFDHKTGEVIPETGYTLDERFKKLSGIDLSNLSMMRILF